MIQHLNVIFYQNQKNSKQEIFASKIFLKMVHVEMKNKRKKIEEFFNQRNAMLYFRGRSGIGIL